MTFSLHLHIPTTGDAENLAAIAQNHASTLADHIGDTAPILATRLMYSVIYSYMYNMLLLASPTIPSTTRAAELQETLGVILATAGINIDALISFTPSH